MTSHDWRRRLPRPGRESVLRASAAALLFLATLPAQESAPGLRPAEGSVASELEQRLASLSQESWLPRIESMAWFIHHQAEVVGSKLLMELVAEKVHGDHREYQTKITRWLQQLTDDRWLAREEAERVLSEMGGRARGLIEQHRRTGSLLEERERCGRILAALDARGMAKEESETRVLRALVMASLGMKTTPELARALRSALGHPDTVVVENAVRALGVHGADADADLLYERVRTGQGNLRQVALLSLPRLRGAAALTCCRDLLTNNSLSTAEAAACIRNLHNREDAQPLLTELCSSKEAHIAKAAAVKLPVAPEPMAVAVTLPDRSVLRGKFLGMPADGLALIADLPGQPRMELPMEVCSAVSFAEPVKPSPICRVFLIQGTLLTGTFQELTDKHALVKNPRFGDVSISRDKIQGIALDPQLDRLIGASQNSDRVRTKEGFIDGQVRSCKAQTLEFIDSQNKSMQLPLTEVRGILMRRPNAMTPDTASYARLELRSGDRLLADITAVNAGHVGVHVPGLGTAIVPWADVVRLEFGVGAGAMWGFTLIADYTDNKVVEVDDQGNVTCVLEDILNVWDAECLDNGNILVTEFSSSRVIELTRENQVVWEYRTGLRNPNRASRLANGNTLIADTFGQRVLEVTPDKNIAWEYKADKFRPFDAERLSNGNTLMCDVINDRVIEVDAKGGLVWEATKLQSAYDADRLANGNTLVTLRTSNKVVEIDRSGKVVWELKNLNTPSDADRLPNGNTIVAESGAVREFDRNGNVVWKKAMTWAVGVNRY